MIPVPDLHPLCLQEHNSRTYTCKCVQVQVIQSQNSRPFVGTKYTSKLWENIYCLSPSLSFLSTIIHSLSLSLPSLLPLRQIKDGSYNFHEENTNSYSVNYSVSYSGQIAMLPISKDDFHSENLFNTLYVQDSLT